MSNTIYSKNHQYLVGRLKKARNEMGLNQNDVAKKIGRTQSYVSKVEAGQLKIDVVGLKRFVKIYKKSLEYFIL